MSTRTVVSFQVIPMPGHIAMDHAERRADPLDLVVMNEENGFRNVIVDDETVRNVIGHLMDGRPDTAAHFGYGTMWTLGIVS